jgi:hypothetical protein
MVSGRGALVAAALLALAPTRIAGAQSSAESEAAAEALFEEARRLMGEGRYGEACPKFAESHRTDPGVGVLLFLGDCYEKNGQTASAWATFRSAVPMARAAGQAERVRAATERSEALEGRLSKLEIVVTAPPKELVVLRDGMKVARGLWGTAVAVDPGQSAIEARAPGRKSFRVTVDLPPGPTVVRVEVPELAAESLAKQPRRVDRSAATPRDRVRAPSRAESPTAGPDRTLAWIAGSIGVAGVAVGAVFGLAAISAWNDAKTLCPGSPRRCEDETGFDRADDAERHATVSTIAFGIGALGIGTAVVLWVTASDGGVSRGAIVGAAGRF